MMDGFGKRARAVTTDPKFEPLDVQLEAAEQYSRRMQTLVSLPGAGCGTAAQLPEGARGAGASVEEGRRGRGGWVRAASREVMELEMLVVVAYDVADDRRRVRLHTLLLGYGAPVQESVFECELTQAQRRTMERRVRQVIRRGVDHVRYYTLCTECAAKTVDADGTPREEVPEVFVV